MQAITTQILAIVVKRYSTTIEGRMLLCAYTSQEKTKCAYKCEGAHLKRNTIAECYQSAPQTQDKRKHMIIKRERTTNAIRV